MLLTPVHAEDGLATLQTPLGRGNQAQQEVVSILIGHIPGRRQRLGRQVCKRIHALRLVTVHWRKRGWSMQHSRKYRTLKLTTGSSCSCLRRKDVDGDMSILAAKFGRNSQAAAWDEIDRGTTQSAWSLCGCPTQMIVVDREAWSDFTVIITDVELQWCPDETVWKAPELMLDGTMTVARRKRPTMPGRIYQFQTWSLKT